MPEITTITSESLQATVRRLLPSQRGFGQDLEAQNVIVPIIDLTPTAEGSALPIELAQAMALGSSTAFAVHDATVAGANTPGFWRIQGTSFVQTASTGDRNSKIAITDGLSAVTVYDHSTYPISTAGDSTASFDLIVFLKAGESFTFTGESASIIAGSYRQVADVNGNTVNPNGFTFE